MSASNELVIVLSRMMDRQREEVAADVNTLCALVDQRPDADDIYSNLPIWEGELSGEDPTTPDLVRMRDYLKERLEEEA